MAVARKPAPPRNDGTLSLAEAARRAGCGQALVASWIRTGKLSDLRAGHYSTAHERVDRTELESLIACQQVATSFPFGNAFHPAVAATAPSGRKVVSGGVVLERIQFAVDEARAAKFRAWTPRPGLPGPTRASCPPTLCPFVACRHHLSRLDGHDRPGRRGDGRRLPPPTLIPLWLDGSRETCSLRVADRVAATGETMEIADVARVLGIRDRQTHATLTRALAALGVRKADIKPLVHDVKPLDEVVGERRRRAARIAASKKKEET